MTRTYLYVNLGLLQTKQERLWRLQGGIYEWLKDNIHMYNGECEGDRKAIIEDLKQAMKDECI